MNKEIELKPSITFSGSGSDWLKALKENPPVDVAQLQAEVERLRAVLTKIAQTKSMSYSEREKLPYNWQLAEAALQHNEAL
jgi:hypothetical protein